MTEAAAQPGSSPRTHEPDEPAVDHAARADALERRLADLEATYADRLVRAELRAEAVRHGMVDLDGIKLIDPKGVALGEDGEIRGASTIMRDFKRQKPWLFGLSNTSSTAAAPPAHPPRARAATEMSHDEWQAARRELVRRR